MLAPLPLPIDTRGGRRVNEQSDGYERSGELKKAVAHRCGRLEITPQAPEGFPPGPFSIHEAIATTVTPDHSGTCEEETGGRTFSSPGASANSSRAFMKMAAPCLRRRCLRRRRLSATIDSGDKENSRDWEEEASAGTL